MRSIWRDGAYLHHRSLNSSRKKKCDNVNDLLETDFSSKRRSAFYYNNKKKNSKKFSIIISRNHGNHNNIFSSATANKLAEGRKMFGRVERFPSTNGAFLTSEKFPASDKERHVTAKSNCASDRFIRQNSIVSFKGSGKRPHVTISPRDWRFERSRDFSL